MTTIYTVYNDDGEAQYHVGDCVIWRGRHCAFCDVDVCALELESDECDYAASVRKLYHVETLYSTLGSFRSFDNALRCAVG
jgi:hypothetical protein